MSKLHKKCPTIVNLLNLDAPQKGLDYTIDDVFIKTMHEKSPEVEVTRFEEDAKVYIVSKNILDTARTIDVEAAKGYMDSSDLVGMRYDFILGNDLEGLLSVEIVRLEIEGKKLKENDEMTYLAFFNYFSGHGVDSAMNDVHVGYVDLVNNKISVMGADEKGYETGQLIMQLLIYMHFGDITTKVYQPTENIAYSKTLSVKNDLKTPVVYVNTLWKQRVCTEGFPVKGHWRMQVHGAGRAKKKLIWIEAFAKSGYNRKATKELQDG